MPQVTIVCIIDTCDKYTYINVKVTNYQTLITDTLTHLQHFDLIFDSDVRKPGHLLSKVDDELRGKDRELGQLSEE